MSTPRKPTSVVLPAVVALVLLAAYVGAYYAMVRPDIFEAVNALEGRGERPQFMPPRYVLARRNWTPLLRRPFAPAHWLDCHLRPQVWKM